MNINEHLTEPTIKPVLDLIASPTEAVVNTPVVDAPIETTPIVTPYKADETIALIMESYQVLKNKKSILSDLKVSNLINKDKAAFIKDHFDNIKSDVRLSQESFTEAPSAINLKITVDLIESDVVESEKKLIELNNNQLLNGFVVLRAETGIRNTLVDALVDHLNSIILKTDVLNAIHKNTNTVFYGGEERGDVFNIATTPLSKIVSVLETAPALDETTKSLLKDLLVFVNVGNFSMLYYALKESINLTELKDIPTASCILSVADISLSELLEVLCNTGMGSVLQSTETLVETTIKTLEEKLGLTDLVIKNKTENSKLLNFLTSYHVDVDNVLITVLPLLDKLEPLLV